VKRPDGQFRDGRSQNCDDEKFNNASIFEESGIFSTPAESGELYALSEV
jgi:hypothetical protein